MKYLMASLLVTLFVSVSQAEIIVAGQLGGVSSTDTIKTSRETNLIYGLGADYFMRPRSSKSLWNAIGAGINYSHSTTSSGEGIVNISQMSNWLTIDAKYRYLNDTFLTPFALLGGGWIFKSIDTQVAGETSADTGSFVVGEFGGGVNAALTEALDFGITMKYYQYSNINGFQTFVSLSYSI